MPHTEEIQLSRPELYELAWSKPMTHLARELSLPPMTLSELLRKLDIPLPKPGHWQKIANGRSVRRPPLPNSERDDKASFSRVCLEPGEQLMDLPLPGTRTVPPYEVFESQPENLIAVPETLDGAHKLVLQAQKVLAKGKIDDEFGWTGPAKGDGRPYIDICVSPDHLDYALRIMDGLLKGLAARHLRVKVDEKYGGRGSTTVNVAGEDLAFGIYERLARVKSEKKDLWEPNTRWKPTGELAFRIYKGFLGEFTMVSATSKKSLDQRLNDFVVRLYDIAEKRQRERQRWEVIERQREAERLVALERQRIEEEKKLAEKRELEKLVELEHTVECWDRAKRIREFVAAAYDTQATHGVIGEGSEFGQYLKWALGVAARLDPLGKREV